MDSLFYQSSGTGIRLRRDVKKLLKTGALVVMLLQLLGSKKGCGPMPESGVYAGESEKYYFRWDVRETTPNGRNGRVDIHASRLDVPGMKNITCYDVRYWQGGPTKYTMDLDRDNKDLIELSNKLGLNPRDWWGFSHGLHWIEAFGVTLEPV